MRSELAGVLSSDILDDFLGRLDGEKVEREACTSVDQIVASIADETRADHGMFMTPRRLARGLVSSEVVGGEPIVVDLAAGTGELLLAAIEANPEATVVGVERTAPLAIAAAIRLRAAVGRETSTQSGPAARLFVGDGLATDGAWCEWEGRADAVLANPPYVGEKGNRERFGELRDEHPHLEEWFGPRVDLAYLFVHRALDYLRVGGELSLLTPEYWLAATGADRLREDLARRAAPKAFVKVSGMRPFRDAPGHHSMLSLFERVEEGAEPTVRTAVACEFSEEPTEWEGLLARVADGEDGTAGPSVAVAAQRRVEAFGAGTWSPFVDADTASWGRVRRERGTPLGELVEDRQGFVSGADRVTARRLGQLDEAPDALRAGDPAFVWRREELTDAMRRLRGLVVRPLLRGSELVANAVRVEPPEEMVVLYIDDELAEDQEWVVEHLRPLKPALERRREVRRGSMPWYRLHWPRDRAEQTFPKLVVPRRAPEPQFMLDLSASAVSSDCTYLVAPEGTARPVRYLLMIMHLLNHPSTDRYLRNFGKQKGDLLEFYSEPLRKLPLPVEVDDGHIRIDENLAGGELAEEIPSRVNDICHDFSGPTVSPAR